MKFEDIQEAFQPYDRLIEIDICGQKRMVPENNSLLRCFQFLALENISYGDFCWNGECINCQVWLKNGEKEKPAMACRTIVAEDMTITRMSEVIDLQQSAK